MVKSLIPVLALLAPAAAFAQSSPELLYVSNEDSGTISVIDAATAKVVTTTEVGVRPRGIRTSPDGKYVFAALSGSPKCPPTMDDEECEKQVADKAKDGIAMVDAATHKLLRVLPGGSDPEQFDISPDGKTIYVSNEDVGKASVVDVASGKIVKEFTAGGEPEGVKVSPDGKLVFVTSEEEHSVVLFDAVAGKPGCHVEVGKRPRDIVFLDNTRAFVSSEVGGDVRLVDGAACKVTQTIKMPANSRPMGLALSADRKFLYVANGRAKTVVEVDLATGKPGRSVEAGIRPWGIMLSRDGSRLFTANGPSNDVSVIDVKSFQVTQRIPTGKSPWGIAASP